MNKRLFLFLIYGIRYQRGFNPLRRLMYFYNYFKFGVFGDTVRIDASTNCQLRCPACIIFGKRFIGQGNLSLKNFRKFISKNSWVKNIEISNFGEIFLNPQLKEIIKFSYEKKINLTAMNGTNLNHIDNDTLKSLVKYKFKSISVSIDGASDKIYKIYRVGGDLNKVILNIKKINELKKKLKSRYPRLIWQFIVFDHNKHEIQKARKMAKELNMKFRLKKANETECLKFNPPKVLERTPKPISSKKLRPFCYQVWCSPQLNWDGRLLGCCVNMQYSFGDGFGDLQKALKSKKYLYLKKMLLGKVPLKKEMPCASCKYYKNI